MTPRTLLLASSLLVATTCTARSTGLEPEFATPGQRRAALARAMQLELPEEAGGDEPSPGPSIFLGPREITVEHVDGRLEGGLMDAEARAGDPMISALYGALEADRGAPGLNVYVDRRVTLPLLGRVLHTAWRGEWHDLRLIGGTPERPGALRITPSPMCNIHLAVPPFSDVRADLALEWGAGGVFAVALPRPADREPFDVGFEEPPPPDTDAPNPAPPGPSFPERVPLRLGASGGPQDALDLPALRRLVADLCGFNHGPMGIELEPLPTTSYVELLTVALAASAEAACPGPLRLGLRDEPQTAATAAVPVARLRAEILTLATGAAPP